MVTPAGKMTEDGWVDLDGLPDDVDPRTIGSRWSAEDLMGATFPEPKWAVPGLIPEGVTLLAGAPKVGKSWLALGLAQAVASGGHALGRVPVDPGDCLYYALEDTPRRIQRRLAMVLEGAPVPGRLHFDFGWQPDTAVADLETWLEDHGGARLVVVDVLARVRGPALVGESAYGADYAALVPLKRLADLHHVAIVVVHHVRKAGAEDWLDRVSGTNGLAGAADAVVVLARSRGAADAKLYLTGRDVEEAEHALSYDASHGAWTMLDGPASDYDLSDERRRIVAAVRHEEGLGPKQIAVATSITYDVVKHLVRKMVDADQLDTDGAGHYFPVHSVHSVHHDTPSGEHGERSEQEEDG